MVGTALEGPSGESGLSPAEILMEGKGNMELIVE